MKSWVIGNWKLNPATVAAVDTLVDDLIAKTTSSQADLTSQCHLMVAPSFLHLNTVQQKIATTPIKLASQDVASLSATTGAYTGDVSAEQLQDLGVQWAIIGHSERRQYYQEDNAVLLQKLLHSAAQGLGVILCIGESEADFDAGNTEQVLAEQLTVIDSFLQQLDSVIDAAEVDQYITDKLIIAYEPVWAIGTGKVPSVDEVTAVHGFIRQRLQSLKANLDTTPIIYGGSVKPDNAANFAASEQINGVLVGGAALQAQSFIDIAQAFANKVAN
ncbi:triose-phosphate isomerase [Psychrobacter sp. FDAARGOS_221]|uniref:triose-phosphate isomerase n=1 Tax=Psychrobacter sp. FDAARGOS_221 TaxID=1975705 RepID=UPI000BB52C2E|nr:triose-phosphate isomerase [Psychrobacter sp. FDAARGOS_221]PNK60588.1 triose-phosphate isomerase [Psychrobacter sp. FDAARGOS_221]